MMSRMLLLLVASTLPAAAATPLDTRHARGTITLEFLMESCSVVGETAHGLVPHFDCESFLYGVIDTHAVQSDGTCVNHGIAPWQLYALIDDEFGDDGEMAGSPGFDATGPRYRIARERWNGPAAPLLVEALEKSYPCGGAAPVGDGEHAFTERFAEHPLMPGHPVVAIVEGTHIRIEDRRRLPEYPEDRVLAEGTLTWHVASREWIIARSPADMTAEEVGGCSDGPETIDFVTREHWTC